MWLGHCIPCIATVVLDSPNTILSFYQKDLETTPSLLQNFSKGVASNKVPALAKGRQKPNRIMRLGE